MSRVLIAGCGYVGKTLARLMIERGHTVIGLGRGLPLPRATFEWIAADVTRPESLGVLPKDIDQVIYMVSPGASDEVSYRRVYVEGVGNLLDALEGQRRQPTRFVFVSSTGVYAQEDGEWVDEDSPANQRHYTGAALLEGERIVREGRIPSMCVRFGGIYGPTRTRLIDSVRSGIAKRPLNASWLNLIHRDDCAGMLAHVMALDDPKPLYLGVDCEPVERGELLTWIAERLGVARPAQATKSSTSPRVSRGNKRCSNRRLLESGYTFRYPTYREGLAPLLHT